MIVKAKTFSQTFKKSSKEEIEKEFGRASLKTIRKVLSLHHLSLLISSHRLGITTGKTFSTEKIPIVLLSLLRNFTTISVTTTNTLPIKKVRHLNHKLLLALKIDSCTNSHAWTKISMTSGHRKPQRNKQ